MPGIFFFFCKVATFFLCVEILHRSFVFYNSTVLPNEIFLKYEVRNEQIFQNSRIFGVNLNHKLKRRNLCQNIVSSILLYKGCSRKNCPYRPNLRPEPKTRVLNRSKRANRWIPCIFRYFLSRSITEIQF